MSFAARAARFAVAASLAASATFSAGGLLSPQSVAAADSGSARMVQQPAISIASTTSVQSVAQTSGSRRNQRARIVRITRSHLGASYRFGAEGQRNTFDCSGLVYAVFKEAGLVDKIGGIRRGARGYYHWFKRRGLASRHNPRPGDLVIWHKGQHIGIYIGDGQIISAVNKKYDVREHGLNFVSGFTAYLHVRLHGHGLGNTGSGDNTSVPPTTVKATVDGLTVRNGPGHSFRQLAVIQRGTEILVTNRTHDSAGRTWLKGELPSGKVGWVRARHVTQVA
jgi:cell wall-associated NlpC family hydrolase